MKKLVKIFAYSLLLCIATYSIIYQLDTAYASEQVEIPEPIKIVDFSYSFTELGLRDDNWEVVDNVAKPKLVTDKEMGQVLQLGKTVISDRKYSDKAIIESENTDYSIIKLTNPYKGLTKLKEYEPYEDVKTVMYQNWQYPYWEEGITISYWIKCPDAKDSNIIGFSSERFQMHSLDYGLYLATYRFDLEYNKYTDEEKIVLGFNESGVDESSMFYFEYAEDGVYNGKPVYASKDILGKVYYMNKNYVPGYFLNNDGTYSESYNGKNSYENYCEIPYLGSSPKDHNPRNSNIRYGWMSSEMWLDASSSFYYRSDITYENIQLNPNHAETYNTEISLDEYNEFCINSYDITPDTYGWPSYSAPSPVSQPDEWHYVVAIIQNDWVRYYLDGIEIDVENEYGAFGSIGLGGAGNIWKWFNKGTGSRFGYGTFNVKKDINNVLYGGFASTTILEWLIMDSTDMVIGGGNRAAFINWMCEYTDEVLIKNIVFYDEMLTDEQIKVLASEPGYYGNRYPYMGDANSDNKVTVRDALLVLKHVAKVSDLESTEHIDVNFDNKINTEDALLLLKYSADIISEF